MQQQRSIFTYEPTGSMPYQQMQLFGELLPTHQNIVDKIQTFQNGYRSHTQDKVLVPGGLDTYRLPTDVQYYKTLQDSRNDQRPVWWRNERMKEFYAHNAPLEPSYRISEGVSDDGVKVVERYPDGRVLIMDPMLRM